MEGHARRAKLASTRARQDPATANGARITLSRPQQAVQSQTALATLDGLGLMEGHVWRVLLASTNRRRDPVTVTNAQQALRLPVVA